MNNEPFRYNKNIDKYIVKAIETSLNTKVISSEKIQKGEFNHVYKVTTDMRNVIIRVFRSSGWPEADKPMWIEERLTDLNVPHAKILYNVRDSKFFPYGFMITEFIDGENGLDAIKNGNISFEEYHKQLSEILSQIHKVRVDNYGLLNGGNGQYTTFTKYKLKKLHEEWTKAKEIENFTEILYKKSKEIVEETFGKLENRFSPVLIHGDAGPDNSIVTPEGKIILVDWDSAKSSIWFEDYSWMMYWGSHLSSFGPREDRMKKIFEYSSEITTNSNFTTDELWQLTNALHIAQAIDLLAYYYIDQKNIEAYKNTLERLTNLLG